MYLQSKPSEVLAIPRLRMTFLVVAGLAEAGSGRRLSHYLARLETLRLRQAPLQQNRTNLP